MNGIVEHNDIQREVLDYWRNGGGTTYYLGFNTLSQHYSIKEGGVTDWTGYAGSGKTELLLECLKNCSDWYGHNHLIYMPDAGTNAEVVSKIIHKMTGKQVDKFYYKEGQKIEIENRISEEEILKILPTVLEHFKIFNPSLNNRSKAVTPKEFWQYAADNKKKLNLFGTVIDSWNYMRHDIGQQREDKWLEETLSFRNEIAENHNLHNHTIIHPKSAKHDREGKIIIPDMHCLKGGSEWSNNGKTIIIVHRDYGSYDSIIKIDKAKPKIVGVQGTVVMNYDIAKGSYYEIVGGDNNKGIKKYAEKLPIKNKEVKNTITPNLKFEDEETDLPF
tara:strand:+ start:467 stop:1462 length:996 start_codon:yes stop_codon:yes gene_type:complete